MDSVYPHEKASVIDDLVAEFIRNSWQNAKIFASRLTPNHIGQELRDILDQPIDQELLARVSHGQDTIKFIMETVDLPFSPGANETESLLQIYRVSSIKGQNQRISGWTAQVGLAAERYLLAIGVINEGKSNKYHRLIMQHLKHSPNPGALTVSDDLYELIKYYSGKNRSKIKPRIKDAIKFYKSALSKARHLELGTPGAKYLLPGVEERHLIQLENVLYSKCVLPVKHYQNQKS